MKLTMLIGANPKNIYLEYRSKESPSYWNKQYERLYVITDNGISSWISYFNLSDAL